jgi:hypothetical protein
MRSVGNVPCKRPDWRERLERFVLEHSERPFVWGISDCVLFVADAILAMTGVDVAASYRERYSSEAGAQTLMNGRSLEQMMNEALGIPLPVPRFARFGDPCLVSIPSGMTAGLVMGEHVAVQGPSRVVRVPVRCVVAAWRLPEATSCLQR